MRKTKVITVDLDFNKIDGMLVEDFIAYIKEHTNIIKQTYKVMSPIKVTVDYCFDEIKLTLSFERLATAEEIVKSVKLEEMESKIEKVKHRKVLLHKVRSVRKGA